jgi:hypothetical protein
VIRTRSTSIEHGPMAPRSAVVAVAVPAFTSSAICSTGEVVGEHHRLSAAVAAGGEQFERTAAVGLWPAAEGSRHWGGWAFGTGRQGYQIPALGRVLINRSALSAFG